MTITGLPMKTVDRGILAHAHERRGFVTVPLDPDDAALGTLEVFWRLLPPHGGSVDDADKPIVVVINGGPGMPASFYRPLDFDYEADAPKPGVLDRFRFLLRDHRVLIADQRGTDGGSAPLDMDDATLEARLVARYFSSDAHARDYAAVIDAVVPEGEPFYVIAQSYGGMPGMQYVGARELRRPRGIVFSSSALPYEDALGMNLDRRREQLRLNLALRDVVPDIEARVAAVRAHMAAEGVDPGKLNGLYMFLGKGVDGEWEPGLVRRLDKILGQTGAEIAHDMAEGQEEPSLLNYILSCVNFTAGHTDRTLALHARENVALEPWMFDETWVLLQTGQDGGWRQALVAGLDAEPPEPTPMPSVEALRDALTTTQALFTAAEGDAFVPAGAYRASVEKFLVPGHTEVRTLPGGHNAIFLEKGYEAFLDWTASIG